jgi:membrane-bound metal-dependent hydrolase YbcI (DUF457 family)
MPFTPFHFGVALPFIFWDWKKKRIDVISALIGTVIVDIRAIYLFLFTSRSDFHGFLHSFLSAIILGILAGIFVHLTRKQWNILLKLGKWEQETSLLSKIIVACVFTTSHIFLDAALYGEGIMAMEPLWPFASGNLLYQWLESSVVHAICVYGFLLGFIEFLGFLVWRHFHPSEEKL